MKTLIVMLRKITICCSLIVLGLVLLLNLNLNIEGTYVFVNGGKCHFLPFYQDTLILHDDGKVESKNFPVDAVFTRKKSLFEDEIKISSRSKNESSYLLVRGNIFLGKRLIVCVDQKGYYQRE